MTKESPFFILANWRAPKNVRAVTTTRVGGYSLAPYDEFNLALHVGDDAPAVDKNRKKLKAELQLPGDPSWLKQVHGNTVIDAQWTTPALEADGSYTYDRGKVCAILSADCLPICLCDRGGRWVAVLHGGWRGLLAGIIEAGAATWRGDAGQCVAWLGPAIGPSAFVVGDDVRDPFLKKGDDYEDCFLRAGPDKWYMHIYAAARTTLKKLGIEEIYGGDYCTATDEHLFYSYRRDRTCGRMATLIWVE